MSYGIRRDYYTISDLIDGIIINRMFELEAAAEAAVEAAAVQQQLLR